MIANSSLSNLGGVVTLRLALVDWIASFRSFQGTCRLTYAAQKAAVNIHFSPLSCQVSSKPEENSLFLNSISWLSPKDRPSLLTETLKYLHQKCIILVTFASGEVKVFGDLDFPLTLNFNPTDQSVPSEYNGCHFYLTAANLTPGRFLIA